MTAIIRQQGGNGNMSVFWGCDRDFLVLVWDKGSSTHVKARHAWWAVGDLSVCYIAIANGIAFYCLGWCVRRYGPSRMMPDQRKTCSQ